jgi:predicted GNAT family N-acyltransferase
MTGREAAFISSDPALLARATDLRTRVFVGEQGVPAELEIDGRDPAAAHVILQRDGVVIGTARIFDEGHAAVVGRVAVAPALRGQGLGAVVMDVAERWAGDQGLALVELHAQQRVIGFYERLGYTGVGDIYFEADIPHLTMRKNLIPGLRPVSDSDSAAIIELIGTVWAEYPGVILDVDGEEPWMRAPGSYYEAGGELWVLPFPDSGALMACVGWRPHESGAELKSLYIAADSRRQGWGSRLVHFIERRVGGRERLTAWSDSRFLDSHAMYERLGYARTGATRELHDVSETVEIEFVGRARSR